MAHPDYRERLAAHLHDLPESQRPDPFTCMRLLAVARHLEPLELGALSDEDCADLTEALSELVERRLGSVRTRPRPLRAVPAQPPIAARVG
jgi:hypothetical protein